MSDLCIINYITRNAWHPHGQARLKESLDRVNFEGDLLLLDDKNFPCMPHNKIPYAFKLFAMMKAYSEDHKILLWVDASFWAIRNMDGLVEEIQDKGFLVQNSGYPLGQWMSDDCLKRMKLNRNNIFDWAMFSGGFMGIDLTNEKMREFFNEFCRYAIEGNCFKGAWRNRKNEVSTDPRVKGHRHDMTVGSVLMNDRKMKIQPNNKYFNYYKWHEDYKATKDLSKVYFVCEGGTRKLPNV